jgi:hypothetical protein
LQDNFTLLDIDQLVAVDFLAQGDDHATDIGQRLLPGHHGATQHKGY